LKPATDDALIDVFLSPVRKCANYKPAFGQSGRKGLVVREFRKLYGSDLFYAWLGLDSPEMYAAHKAAGGITSMYRQIGVGSERLFRAVLAAELGLSNSQMKWSYEYEKSRRTVGIHTLDARIATDDLKAPARERFAEWLGKASAAVTTRKTAPELAGATFEVRQGYKSADSKRQNADLRYGIHAYQADLLPAFAVFSAQVSEPVIRRYRSDGMLVLTGTLDKDPLRSTFAFFSEVVGYDLAGFFDRNAATFRLEVTEVVQKLLEPA
jgi:hypothetical protein